MHTCMHKYIQIQIQWRIQGAYLAMAPTSILAIKFAPLDRKKNACKGRVQQ